MNLISCKPKDIYPYILQRGGKRRTSPSIDKFWVNYRQTFEIKRGAKIVTYPLLNEDSSFNYQGLKDTFLNYIEKRKAIVLLNFNEYCCSYR